ncbi:prolyl aminopeptidase [Albidovulum sediminis]|uniref:Proline iminopeptidase n=1 Tax=Albidovulum sediminis TaxID=3066345 RepID=A0ABT2NRL9_9RHOB|nr:prolyl aminopeptidase [Defluviimonas sediminis]MCT8331335.1 prolyl aminopeptidase [Defluviimonas sediminis]
MDRSAGQKRTGANLYSQVEPFDRQFLDVGEGHRVYVEQCGQPDGLPVLVLHGGPGGGSSPAMRRFFDPSVYRVVLFDQRGCGRSEPNAAVQANTTWHLVADIERIRKALGIDRWIVFGGSWGATLGLIYAETHPDRVIHLVLRGVFLMTQAELDWFYGGGAGAFWPELWQRFAGMVPADERADLIGAYHKRLFSGNPAEEARFARAWTGWENALASIENEGLTGDAPSDYARAFARLENHYFVNHGFLETDGQILRDLPKIQDIPGTIVQGRYDMICPPLTAWKLTQSWRRSELRMIPVAGHALSEPGISAELVRVMDGLRA